jgi:hypothetical protein
MLVKWQLWLSCCFLTLWSQPERDVAFRLRPDARIWRQRRREPGRAIAHFRLESMGGGCGRVRAQRAL